jgi:hypothetical protein
MGQVELDPAEEWSDSDVEDFSDSEVGDALDWLDAVEGPDGAARPSASFSTGGGVAAARRPNAHGGVLSRPFQPLFNRTQKLASHIRATPLEVCSCNFCTAHVRDVQYRHTRLVLYSICLKLYILNSLKDGVISSPSVSLLTIWSYIACNLILHICVKHFIKRHPSKHSNFVVMLNMPCIGF